MSCRSSARRKNKKYLLRIDNRTELDQKSSNGIEPMGKNKKENEIIGKSNSLKQRPLNRIDDKSCFQRYFNT